ncbi:hypothetical protein CHS0354_015960 [Potamilus streckersoni]|nr:hypothetical protein CHS0354_015960 [Potamilus streckersoni]
MWQHKQEERELKRTEGDIVKNQRAVRQTLRDYENAITKKRMEEEKKLNTGLEKYTKLQREQTHKKEDIFKQRTERGIIKLQQNKSLGRKVALKSSDIARKYHTKLSDLELKRIEVMRLSQEFENKMRQKEEEQYKLKAELAELAIALNMETQKGRVHKFEAERDRRKEIATRINEDLTTDQSVESKLAKSEGDTKAAEMNKRKLSADMLLTRSHLSIKQRDEQRHLTDTQMRLADNSNVQRQLNEAAFHAEMDLKARQIDQKVEAHNTRRVSQLQTSMKHKKEKEESQQRELEEKFRRRQAEEQRKQHEDSLKFFKKMVSKGEDLEQMLYGKVRNCEYNRQKQEQNVRRIQQALSDLRKKNASKVKEEIAECFQLEKDLEQKLLKEKAELDKVHAEREESYFRLQKHRQILREDKHNLVEHEKEHTRLIRIGSRSDSYLTD